MNFAKYTTQELEFITSNIEFLCIHPYNEEYSLFLNQNKDGMPKFYNKRLKDEEWYLYDRKDNFNEEIDMRIELLNKHINELKSLKGNI